MERDRWASQYIQQPPEATKKFRYLRRMIQNYLRERTLELQDVSRRKVTSRVPQGSVLGPTIRNVIYNKILILHPPPGVNIVWYS